MNNPWQDFYNKLSAAHDELNRASIDIEHLRTERDTLVKAQESAVQYAARVSHPELLSTYELTTYAYYKAREVEMEQKVRDIDARIMALELAIGELTAAAESIRQEMPQ